MTDKNIYTTDTDENENDEEVEETLDFSKVLAGVKELTTGAEETNKKIIKQNQILSEVLAKIEELTDGSLGKNDINKIFQSFSQNFKSYLKTNLSMDQLKVIRTGIESLIDSVNFDDDDLEQQMNDLYTILKSITENETWNTEITSTIGETIETNSNIDLPDSTQTEDQQPEPDISDTKEDEKTFEDAEEVNERSEEDTKDTEQEEREQKEVEQKVNKPSQESKKRQQENKKAKQQNSQKSNKNISKKPKLDMSRNWEYMDKYISDKDFPGKDYISDIINIKETECIKSLQLQLVPIYKGHIDGELNDLTVKAIENYVKNNMGTKEDNSRYIKKDDGVIRCNVNGIVIHSIAGLNIVITKSNNDLGHVYFLDYPDFEYEKEGNKIRATAGEYNYVYDIETKILNRSKQNDVPEMVTDDPFNKYLDVIKNFL